jgi:hypothetical protein
MRPRSASNAPRGSPPPAPPSPRTAPAPCRWAPCGRDAAPVGARGPAGAAAPTSGGRRPEFCSEAHQRATSRAVRDLRRLLDDTIALSAEAPVREHKQIDAALADIRHRLLLPGEAPPQPQPADQTPADASPRNARPGVVVALRPAPAPSHTGRRADSHCPCGETEQGHRAAREPSAAVLALRPPADPATFADDWEYLREANDGARLALDRIRRARDDDEREVLARAYRHVLTDLAQASDQIVTTLIRLRNS